MFSVMVACGVTVIEQTIDTKQIKAQIIDTKQIKAHPQLCVAWPWRQLSHDCVWHGRGVGLLMVVCGHDRKANRRTNYNGIINNNTKPRLMSA